MNAMDTVQHISMIELEAGLKNVRQSPRDNGVLRLIVRRPRVEEREILEQGELDPHVGLVGDCWKTRGSPRTPDESADPEAQLTIMNARAIDLVAQDKDRWALAGDQLYIDLDLSRDNLPPGTRLALGSAVIEVSAAPHTGCQKFRSRFGLDAVKFVNSPVGRELQLRGINAKVVQAGAICVGDLARKL
jgi:hypothetical protein